MKQIFGLLIIIISIPLQLLYGIWRTIMFIFHAIFKTEHYKDLKRRNDEINRRRF